MAHSAAHPAARIKSTVDFLAALERRRPALGECDDELKSLMTLRFQAFENLPFLVA